MFVVGYGFECAADLIDVFVAAVACVFAQKIENKTYIKNVNIECVTWIYILFHVNISMFDQHIHESGCNNINWRHNTGRIWNLYCIRMFEDAMWFPTTRRFLFPIALYLITCLLNNHVTFGTILLKTLTFCPFWTDTFMS